MSVSSVHFVSQDPLHSSAGAMSPIHVLESTNMDPLQDPCLWIHGSPSICISGSSARSMSPIPVSASLYLRVLCNIHVSDSCLSIHFSESAAWSMYQYSCLGILMCGSSPRSVSQHSYLWIASQYQPPQQIAWKLFTRHMSVSSVHFVSQDPLHSSAGAMSPIHVLASTNMDPLQDPHIRIHVSASLYLRLLCKIHVSGSMAHHPYVSQGPLQDPCLRIHISASICISGSSTRSTSSDSCLSIFVSQAPLQDPCLWIHGSPSVCIPGPSARSMSPDPYLSIHMYLRILCKIHVSDSCLSIFISQGPLQHPCLRIHVSASICISGSSARSMSPDPCLSIRLSESAAWSMYQYSCLGILMCGSSPRSVSQHSYLWIASQYQPPRQIAWKLFTRHMSVSSVHFVSQDPLHSSAGAMSPIHVLASTNMDPLQDPHIRIHVSASLYLRLLCKIHVSGSMAHHPYVSQGPLQDPCLRIHISASICISGCSTRSTSSDSCLSIFVSQAPLQNPCLRIHVSASICISGSSARSMSPDPCLRFMSQHPLLRIRRMIHVSVFMSRRPYVWILSKIRISAFIPVDSLPVPAPATNRVKIVYRTYVCVFCTLRMSRSFAFLCRSHVSDSCLSIHQFNMDPLQDPHIRIHVSASLYLRLLCNIPVSGPRLTIRMYLRALCKIHVSGSISQHPYVSQAGSSARSMSPIPVSASWYLRVLCNIHVSGSMSQHPYVSQDPLQDPCLRIHVSDSCLTIRLSESAAWSMYQYSCLGILMCGSSPRSVSQHSYLWIASPYGPPRQIAWKLFTRHMSVSFVHCTLCISRSSAFLRRSHVSDSCLSIHQYGSSTRSTSSDSCLGIFVFQAPLQHPCLWTKAHHPYVSQDPLQDPCLRIHISASICISGSSARSMSPIPVSASLCLRVLCNIHVSGSMSPIDVSASAYPNLPRDPCISIHVSASLCVDPLQDPYLSIHTCG